MAAAHSNINTSHAPVLMVILETSLYYLERITFELHAIILLDELKCLCNWFNITHIRCEVAKFRLSISLVGHVVTEETTFRRHSVPLPVMGVGLKCLFKINNLIYS